NSTTTRQVQSLCIICNERAANDADVQSAAQILRAEGRTVELRCVRKPDTVATLAAAAAQAGIDAIVAAGGDGTLNEVVNGVSAAGHLGQCGVGVLPFGTAN